MAYDRRTLLKAMAGTSAAGLLAGCGGEVEEETTGDLATTVGVAQTQLKGEGGGKVQTCIDNNRYGTIQPDADTGTASYWHARTTAGAELVTTIQNRFNNNTKHTLETSQIPNSTYNAKLQSAIPSGDGPYLFEWAHDKVGQLNSFVSDQTGKIDIPSCMLTDKSLKVTEFDGKRFGVPWAAETVTLMYNKDIVDSPPETFDDMVSIMDDYADIDNGKFGIGYPLNGYYVSGFAQAYGARVYSDETGETQIDTDKAEKGLRLVTDQLAQYMPDDPSTNAQRSVFANGNAPFFISGPWDVAGLQNNEAVNLGLTTVPSLPDGGTFSPFTGIKLLYFTTKMNNGSSAGAARDFAEWFVSNERLLLEHANRGNFVPVHTKLKGNPKLPGPVKTFAEQVETGTTMPQSLKMNKVWGPYGDAVTSTFNGNGDLRSNLNSAASTIREEWNSS